MSTFLIESEGSSLVLRLQGELTIEQARELHAALVTALQPGCAFTVDASAVTRLDAAILQVLVTAAGSGCRATVRSVSQPWNDAFRRYAIQDPYGPPNP
jgi:anti-anti-sigma regulatory factor